MLFELHYFIGRGGGEGADCSKKNKNVFAFEESLCQSPIFNHFGAMDTKNSLWEQGAASPKLHTFMSIAYLLVCNYNTFTKLISTLILVFPVKRLRFL